MSRNYKFYDNERPYFVTFSVVNWIDAFTRREYKDILLDSFRYCMINKGMEIYAWVIMSNHVHLIMGSHQQLMSDILRDVKRHTSKKIVEAIANNTQESRKEWLLKLFQNAGRRNPNNENFQFWQQGNHPIELWSSHVIDQKLDYLHLNPVVAGWVDEPEHYLYSSARDYAGIKGLLDIQMLY